MDDELKKITELIRDVESYQLAGVLKSGGTFLVSRDRKLSDAEILSIDNYLWGDIKIGKRADS